jgi:hypothetical protein
MTNFPWVRFSAEFKREVLACQIKKIIKFFIRLTQFSSFAGKIYLSPQLKTIVQISDEAFPLCHNNFFLMIWLGGMGLGNFNGVRQSLKDLGTDPRHLLQILGADKGAMQLPPSYDGCGPPGADSRQGHEVLRIGMIDGNFLSQRQAGRSGRRNFFGPMDKIHGQFGGQMPPVRKDSDGKHHDHQK